MVRGSNFLKQKAFWCLYIHRSGQISPFLKDLLLLPEKTHRVWISPWNTLWKSGVDMSTPGHPVATPLQRTPPHGRRFSQILTFLLSNEKSAQRRRKYCALAVVRRSQRFSPRRRPPSQLETVTTFTYRLSLVRIDARNFELSW